MTSQNESIICLRKYHLVMASEVLGRAFYNYPVSQHIFPDEKEREEKLKYGFMVSLNYGIRHGIVHATSPNLEGIAVWLPPKKIHISLWDGIRAGGFYALRKSGLKLLKRGKPILNYMVPTHKRLAPFDHWYLLTIGVEPNEHGKGWGSLLLKTMITEIEKNGHPIYLETNTEKNVSFYEKHGFNLIEHTMVSEVPFWIMLKSHIKTA